MKSYKIYRYMNVSVFSLFVLVFLIVNTDIGFAQNDTIIIKQVQNPPVINGYGDDACWQDIQWYSINQVWIPYGGTVSADDFSGRFKVLYSSESDLIYFLVEIVDDMGVDGYSPEGGTADIYNYDILEVFLDENKSGGSHMSDDQGTGQNAENAFAYHMYADFPDEGSSTTSIFVGDMPGEAWSDHLYASHFPEFALVKSGTTYLREFSLKVFNDTYIGTNQEASRVSLTGSKIMGLSLAYCDNDDPDEEPKERDNFFGSAQVTEEAYNNHWWNADDFGPAILKGNNGSTGAENYLKHEKPSSYIFPNPVTNSFNVFLDNEYTGVVTINIINNLARVERCFKIEKNSGHLIEKIDINGLSSGLYSVSLLYSNQQAHCKMIVTN